MTNSNDRRILPIPVCGVPSNVSPCIEMPIELYWNNRDGINWERGEPATKASLEQAIDECRGRHLPNELLPSLSPGDVVVLHDGIFWIDRNWILQDLTLIDRNWILQQLTMRYPSGCLTSDTVNTVTKIEEP